MTIISILGIAAAILTTAAYIPQAYKTIKSKDMGGLSLTTFSMLFFGTITWLIYGLCIKNIPIILANGVTSFFLGIIFLIKLKSVIRTKDSDLSN